MALSEQKKRIIIISVCTFILVALVIAAVIGFTTKSSKVETQKEKKNSPIFDSLKAIKSICQPTDFKQTCEEQLRIEAGNSTDIKELIEAAFKAGVKFATLAAENSTTLRDLERDPRSKKALENCKQLLTYSTYELQKSIVHMNELGVGVSNKILEDLKIWLSATITNQQTCLDGFGNTMTVAGEKMKKALNMSMILSRIGIAIAGEFSEALNQFELQVISRRLLEEKESRVSGHADRSSMLDEDNPWKRRLLQEKNPHVLGHADWSTMLHENQWKNNLRHENKLPVLGHADWSSMLDENNPWKRRLLQEKIPRILGHDDWSSMLESRRLLQEKEPPVLGHDEFSSMLDKRRLLQEKEPPILGHDEFSSMLDKRRLVQEKEPHVLGHDEFSSMLDKRRLLQEKEPHVLGHDEFSSMLDKRRLLQEEEPHEHDQVNPSSMLEKGRLVQENELSVLGHAYWSSLLENDTWKGRLIENDPSKLKPDIVVAKDGSGNFKTIKDAMRHISLNAQKPFVIYIKEGIYEENPIFSYNMTNVALIGDGKDKTRITGRLNVADGLSTFNTATVAVNGDYFFAKNIGFENTAGAVKLQAVALMVISDFAILYNCSIDGYQDTLYVHSKRQFYRDCTISGTIDFVFGDAAAVFQNCKFVVRKPLKGQQNTIIAQGRFDKHQPTGIVIQNSTIVADDELLPLKSEHPTFLGRPMGNFSRTIIMETFIDDLIKLAVWGGHWGSNTSYYSEYNNHGPGSAMNGHVSWSEINKLSPTMALGFTPGKFFLGDHWIKPKGVPYTSGFSDSQTRNVNLKGSI